MILAKSVFPVGKKKRTAASRRPFEFREALSSPGSQKENLALSSTMRPVTAVPLITPALDDPIELPGFSKLG